MSDCCSTTAPARVFHVLTPAPDATICACTNAVVAIFVELSPVVWVAAVEAPTSPTAPVIVPPDRASTDCQLAVDPCRPYTAPSVGASPTREPDRNMTRMLPAVVSAF